MKPRKILFLEASGGGGHISITTSIIQALKKKDPDIQTERVDVMPPLIHKLYQLASRQFVNAYFLLYKATNNEQGENLASKLNSVINRKKLTKIILKHQPDLIFSNYCLAVGEIAKILEKINKNIPFIVFVPDPFTVHSIYLSKKATLTLVSTNAIYQAALNRGISPDKLKITGHPIRDEFITHPTDIKSHKIKLGLNPDNFTILFGGSGHGAEKTLEILIHLGAKPTGKFIRHLLGSTNLDSKTYYKLFTKIFKKRQNINLPPFQAICVCGDNIELKEALEMLQYPSYIKPYIHLQSDNVASLIHASDLVVGKAGPNILLETIMAGKPFLATYHIKGQEDGNIDFIRSAQLGFVEENPQNTANLIITILNNNQQLDYTNLGISYIYQQHKNASQKIAENILKYLKK